MKDRLSLLYELQALDDKLDELESLRGDLPAAVKILEDRMKDIEDEINAKQTEMDEGAAKKKANETEIERLMESQKKFKAQLYQVRNNKEYDALTKEIDHSDDQIQKLENESDALLVRNEQLKEEIEEVKPVLEELEQELKGKNQDLKKIIAANEKEEEKLQKEREKIQSKVKRGDYSNYMRIRKAKNGKAVVTIRRSACSGCHNIVPPQRQLEIRQNNRLYQCEYCGRLLVSNEIAEKVEE